MLPVLLVLFRKKGMGVTDYFPRLQHVLVVKDHVIDLHQTEYKQQSIRNIRYYFSNQSQNSAVNEQQTYALIGRAAMETKDKSYFYFSLV